MKTIIFMFCLLIGVVAKDYQELLKFKQEHPSTVGDRKTNENFSSIPENNSVNSSQIQVILNRKKSIYIEELESRYQLKLKKCIAHRICIFDVIGKNIDITKLSQQLKQEPFIQNVKIYKRYKMKPY
ncbi:hypothetical protein [Nitrosophilus labii]|uniref:hypothetical protein n=1 Tax=Nitrosophilus labii TaxID=2706014 RepID=UPI001657460F|nr:hypothetical protein [Nitrosophilus labii]